MGQMPKVSKQSAAQVDDYGPVENRHEETAEAGDAFYLPPGHIPLAEAGTEYVQFSPTLEHQAVAAAMVKNMQEAQRA
jgi:ribosomal protein L16 Arg81 hydroxylase